MLIKPAGEIIESQQPNDSAEGTSLSSGVEMLSTRPVAALPPTSQLMPARIVETPRPEIDRIATLPEIEAFLPGEEDEPFDRWPTQRTSAVDRAAEAQQTLPLVIPRETRTSQQPTQPTQPIKKRHTGSAGRAMRYGVITIVYLSLIAALIFGHTAIVGWFTALVSPAPAQPQPNVAIVHPRHTVVHSSPIDLATKQFMQAFLRKDWPAIWLMLSPDAQNLYAGESDFVHVMQAKFNGVTFTAYKLRPAEAVQPWLDPDTTQVFPLASVTQVSLDAKASSTALSSLSLADLRNGLFHNTSLALVLYNGKWLVALAGPADLDAPVLVPAVAPTGKLLVPIFMYHHVSNKPTTSLLDYTLTVTTTDFNAQLDWLQQQGYHSITMTELFDALYYGKSLPPHPMILSFDDGYADMYTDALPALLAHHDRGVFYIITGMIGGRYMTWDQVRTLQDEGMQIASHTIHHVNIGAPPAYTTTQDELQLSKQMLQYELGRPIQFFCYPTGEPFHHDTLAEQQLVLADLYSDGYIGATLDPFAYDSAIQDAQTPYQLPRVRVSGGEPLATYKAILNDVLSYDALQLSA